MADQNFYLVTFNIIRCSLSVQDNQVAMDTWLIMLHVAWYYVNTKKYSQFPNSQMYATNVMYGLYFLIGHISGFVQERNASQEQLLNQDCYG